MRKEKSESFRIRPIEVTRVGKKVSMKNIGTDLDNSDLIKALAKEHQNNREKTDSLIREIRELVSFRRSFYSKGIRIHIKCSGV